MIRSFACLAPGRTPTTLCEITFFASTAKAVETVTPFRVTGLKARVWASFFRASKSRPAVLNSATVGSRWIQASIGAWTFEGSLRMMSKTALSLEFLTVFQP
jgi:hypothetical protein